MTVIVTNSFTTGISEKKIFTAVVIRHLPISLPFNVALGYSRLSLIISLRISTQDCAMGLRLYNAELVGAAIYMKVAT